MKIYYSTAIAVNIIAVAIFYKNINITKLSLVPIILIGLMIFQVLILKNEKAENGFRTAYGSNLTDDEENEMFGYASGFLFAILPCMIPFVIFFSSLIKLFSIFVYLIGLGGGLLLYRLKNKNKISSRMNSEEKEHKDQEKREELGKLK